MKRQLHLVGLIFACFKNRNKYSITENVGRLRTLQANSIALMFSFFQHHSCLHMKHSIIKIIVREEFFMKKIL